MTSRPFPLPPEKSWQANLRQRGINTGLTPLLHPLFFFFIQVLGLTLTSEDSSEVAFLLVENYNYDCSCWSSDRQGIFDPFCKFYDWLFVDRSGLAARLKKSEDGCDKGECSKTAGSAHLLLTLTRLPFDTEALWECEAALDSNLPSSAPLSTRMEESASL